MNDPIVYETLLMLAICIAGTGGLLLLAYGIGGLLYAAGQAILRLAKHLSVAAGQAILRLAKHLSV